MSGRCSVEYRVNDFSCRFFICIGMTPRKTILHAVQFYLGLIKVFRVKVVLSNFPTFKRYIQFCLRVPRLFQEGISRFTRNLCEVGEEH